MRRSASPASTGFWQAIIIFAILATIYISRVMLDIYFTQRFIIPLARLAHRPAHV